MIISPCEVTTLTFVFILLVGSDFGFSAGVSAIGCFSCSGWGVAFFDELHPEFDNNITDKKSAENGNIRDFIFFFVSLFFANLSFAKLIQTKHEK
jgi:hypothetical protein